MSKRFVFRTLILLAALSLALVVLASAGNCEEVQQQNSITVTGADNGSKITVSQNDLVIVRLEYTSGTGYTWVADKPERDKLLLMKNPEFAAGDMPGAKGIEIFTFKAMETGPSVIRINYLRPWEKNVPPAETFTLNLEVIAGSQKVSYVLDPVTIKEQKLNKNWSILVRYPEIRNFPKGNQQKSCNDIIKKSIDTQVKQFEDQADKGAKDKNIPWSLYIDYEVKFQSNDYLGVVFTGNLGSGGANPAPIIYSMLLDLNKGVEMNLSDLFNPGANYLVVMSEYSSKKLSEKQNMDESWINKGTAAVAGNYRIFYPNNDSLVIVFPPNQAAPYSEGAIDVPIPYEEFNDLLNPDFKLYTPVPEAVPASERPASEEVPGSSPAPAPKPAPESASGK
ncbi:MAG: protease inhibitor I42 family protein [Chloroflexi bacterium]|nr:protease inhibitor I42 family protein [Chloroflexota bacterium]